MMMTITNHRQGSTFSSLASFRRRVTVGALVLVLGNSHGMVTHGAPVERCRCEGDAATGDDYYNKRKEPVEIAIEKGLSEEQVAIDDQGYYVVEDIKIVPTEMCPPQFARARHLKTNNKKKKGNANDADGDAEASNGNNGNGNNGNGNNGNVFDNANSSNKEFPCPVAFAKERAKRRKLPPDVDTFITTQLNLDRFEQDESTGELVLKKGRNIAPGTLIEEEIDCQDLPLAVLLNPRAKPFHCRCPSVRNPLTLPPYCLNRQQQQQNRKWNRKTATPGNSGNNENKRTKEKPSNP